MMNNSFAEKKQLECEKSHPVIDVPSCLIVKVTEQDKLFNVTAKKFTNKDTVITDFNNTMYDKKLQYTKDAVHNWWTGITLYRIGEINTVDGTYEMYFNHWVQIFEEEDPTDFKNDELEPFFDYIKSVGEPEKKISKGIIQKKGYYDVMVDGKFYTAMDFTKFPFETLDLNITVEPAYNYSGSSERDTVQLHIWPFPGVISDAPSPGYKIESYNITVSDHQYSEGDTYSRYDINFKVQRQILDSFLKFIFPILVMASLAFATLIYPSEQYMTKISLNALFLLGILLFVQTVQEKIVNTGEMTLFDYVVMMSYAIIVVTIANPTIKWKVRKQYEDNKEKRDYWKDRDRRNHDLNLENLRRTEADIIFFKDKLKMCKVNTKEYKDTAVVLKHLNERRQFLDKLKNIDSKISLLLRMRADVKEYDGDAKKFYKRLENLSPDEIRDKVIDFLIESKMERSPSTQEIRKNLVNFLEKSENDENLSTQEIRKKINDILKEKMEKHSGHESEMIYQIIKLLKEYEKVKGNRSIGEIRRRLRIIRAWKKHGKIILKEEFLIEQAKKKSSKSEGTIHDLQLLEEKRVKVVKKLQHLEEITEDHNEEMVIDDERFLKSDLRETISKNELDELDRIKIDNKMFNHIAYVFVGGIVLIGSFFIINVLSVFNF